MEKWLDLISTGYENVNKTEKLNLGFIRVSLCRPNLTVANVANNIKKIEDMIEDISAKTQFICFPELSFTGYTCGDLFHEQFLLDESLKGLKFLELVSKAHPANVIIVGLPFRYQGVVFNTAAVYNNGKLIGLIPKSYLPNYDEFKEKIYFHRAHDTTIDISLNEFKYKIPFGKHILFSDLNNTNFSFGVEICEDLWSVEPPSGKLALQGATLIINISASNDIIGKYEFRRRLIQQQSERLLGAYCYISSGLGESTSELVFSGYGAIYENGKLLGELERFSQNSSILSCDVDIDLLINERSRNTVWGDSVRDIPLAYRKILFVIKSIDYSDQNLLRKINPLPFIPDTTDPEIIAERCREIISIQASGLAMRMLRSKAKRLVIAVSGGLDSTLALLVAVESAKMLNISRDRILAITMPGFGTSSITKSTIEILCNKLGVEFSIIPIVDSITQHFRDINQDNSNYDITFENAQARERTQILFDKANQINGIVVGTGDLSEIALGWSTYNGDQMSSYNVNCSIPKTLVKVLIKWFADNNLQFRELKDLLYTILTIPISPELLPNKEKDEVQQKTEDIIGPYELHDFFLYNFIRYKFTPQKILFMAKVAFSEKYDEETIKKFLNIFIDRFFKNQFKRSAMPEGPKVGIVSLSPRSDWRMPGDISSANWLLKD